MWKTRLAILGVVALLAIVLALLGGLLFLKYVQAQRQRPYVAGTATILKNIRDLNQLVSVQHRMEKVVVLEDPPKTVYGQFLTGESRVILVAHGVAKAGVDLSKLSEGDLRLRGTNLVIKLPKSEILDVYLDESNTQVIEHKTGFLRKFDEKLPQLARQQALLDMRRAAKQNEILEDADARARLGLQKLFTPMGIQVTFED